MSDTVSRWVATLALAGLVAFLGLEVPPTAPLAAVGGAVVVLGARLLLSTPYVIATGGVALVAVTGGDPLSAPLVLVTLGVLLGGVTLPAGWSSRGARTTLVASAVLLGVGAVTVAAFTLWAAVWPAALVAAVTGGLISYGLHRYEQVRLGVVERDQ